MATVKQGKSAKPKSKTQKQKRAMPHFGKAPEELVRTFESAMKNFPMAQRRLTFGFPSATINGNMFAGLHKDDMILRLSPEDAAKMQDAKLFEPMPERTMRGWVVVPRGVLDNARELNAWMGKALEFAKGLPPKNKKAM